MTGDMPDGSFSAAELERLEAAGIIEVHQPGSPEWHEHAKAMADELAVADAEALAIDGPDALTSVRLLRQEAIRAERDPERVGYQFAAWCISRDWDRSDLAGYLGLTVDGLAALATELRSVSDLAERYGADRARLAMVLAIPA